MADKLLNVYTVYLHVHGVEITQFYTKLKFREINYRSQILEGGRDLGGQTTELNRFYVPGLCPIWKNFTYHVYHRKGFHLKVPIGNFFFSKKKKKNGIS